MSVNSMGSYLMAAVLADIGITLWQPNGKNNGPGGDRESGSPIATLTLANYP